MTSNNPHPEPPKSPTTMEPRDPLELLRTLVTQFSALSSDLAGLGVRDRLYTFLKDNFLLGAFYKERLDAYERFRGEEYWRDVRQKPNDRNVMRSVLAFTMRTKGRGREALQNRAYKYARVLEYLHQDEVVSDEVPQRLKDGGGIDAIYAARCRDARPPHGRGDGLERPMAELLLTRTANGTIDDETSLSPADAAQGPLAGGHIDGAASRDDGRQPADEGQQKSVPLLSAANGPTDTLRDAVQPARGSKQGPLDRIDLKTILAVEMFGIQLDDALHAQRATIRAIIGERDDRGWVPVRALSVWTSNSAEGPWPGWPAGKRGNDEQH
jgi:hypothetical protein